MRPLRIAVLIVLLSGLAGCALPPALTIASFVADGLSMASTGKTVTDQAISFLAHKDCRIWRLAQGKPICGSDANVVTVAALPPPLPLRAASPGLHAFEASGAATDASVQVSAAESLPVPLPAAPGPAPLTTAPNSAAAVPDSAQAPARAAPTPRPSIAVAPSAPPRQLAPPSVASVPLAPAPVRHAAGDTRVHGEMVIRSGTDEAEARALADSLHAVGAVVRPVRHGDITIYEVVMGLSG